ncbi:mutator type transposase [Tanacetum coccineum]
MLCKWRIPKKGSIVDPYHDYGAFPTIYCLKINHGGAFTTPPKIRYKGEKKDHSVNKDPLNVDESLLVNVLDNDVFIENQMLKDNDDDVIEDVSEDEWLEKSLRLLGRRKNDAIKDDNVVESKEIVEVVKEGFEDEEVDHEDFHSGSDSEYKVEHRRELHLKKIDKKRLRYICRGKVPRLSCEDGDDVSGSKGLGSDGSKDKSRSKEKDQVSGSKGKLINKIKAGEGNKDKAESYPWHLQRSKLPNEETWADRIKPNLNIPLNALKDQLQKQYEVGISKQKVFRAKKIAHEKIELERPEDINSLERQFKWVYVCLAVWVDLNNGIYPLAYAIVESENKDSWKWFLDCIGDDLDLFKNLIFTFISDRKKGVIPAIAETFPSAKHRFCLKHIYKNMQLSWRGQMYKEMLWRCAIAITVQRFNKHMDKLKDFKKEAYEWLKKIPLKHWFRRAHCDVFLNNMGEVLNRQLKVISKSDGPFTPNAAKLFKTIVKDAGQIKIEWNGGDLYQANTPWGIIVAFWNMASNEEETGIPESYCHQSHWLSTWKDMYRGNKLSRAGKSISCSKCNRIGHNQRRCTNDPSASDPQATKTQQSSQAPPATQVSQIAPTTLAQIAHTAPSIAINRPFHPVQLHASPTKMTKAIAARRMSIG